MASVIEGASHQFPAPPSGSSATSTRKVASQAKEEIKKVSGMTRSRLMEEADARKSRLTSSLRSLAGTLRNPGESSELDPILERVSDFLSKASSKLDEGSTEVLLQRAEGQLRSRPGLVLAGLVGIGFLAGRLLKE